jgi:hypothetical protein
MPLMKYAYASVATPSIRKEQWGNVRAAAKQHGKVASSFRPTKVAMSSNLVERATQILGKPFNPENFLLTHATIVASVDVESPQGVRLGHVMEGGFRVNRRYAEYRIRQSCDKFINNNLDAWSRPVLLKAFETFVGGHNFVEHVQIEEQSKGRIIDAVARDIGDSIYIDILVATDRKHTELVKAITSGKMATMSMGCTVDGTVCTRCGHWAADETEMCSHIKYAKGTAFFDELGRQHRIAELCGHESIDPTGGVRFIEASWVETPAFTGAVLRNVLEPTQAMLDKAAKVLNTPPPEWNADQMQRAARATHTGASLGGDAFLAGWDDEEGDAPAAEEGGEAPPAEKKSPLDETEDELTEHMQQRVKKRIKDEMRGRDLSKSVGDSTAPNDTIQREAAVGVLTRIASTDIALVEGVAALDKAAGISVDRDLYRAALSAGPTSRYSTGRDFLGACASAFGRQPNPVEARKFLRLGSIMSRRGQALRGQQ